MEDIRELYYDDGKLHTKEYCKDNKYHREDGPAVIWYNKKGEVIREWYYINGIKHRENGPAIIWYHADRQIELEEYYIDGVRYTDIFLYYVAVGSL